MKKLLLPLVAAAALAVPASAFAWGGAHGDDRDHHGTFAGMFAKLSGTGTSFAASSATATGSIVVGNDHSNGHFSASLANTGAATTKPFTDKDGDSDDGTVTITCAPSSATITLSNASTSSATYAGKTCSITRNGTTKAGFFGRASNGAAAVLKESGTTVLGAVFSGHEFGLHLGVFAGFHSGNCDHH
jgi:hypothetical protein